MRSRDVFKKKIFRTSTFFCFCMMLVCLIFMLLINNIAIHSIEEQVIQKEEVRLDDIELALNKQIMSIHKFSLNIAANSDLRKDIYMLRENDKTRLGDITKSISMYMNSGGYELDYLVFIDDTNYCISRGGILEKDIAEKLYVTESNLIGRENWDLINNGEYKNMYINIPNQSAEGMDNTVASDKLKLSNVCYILTIMNPYKTEPMATIMVSLDEEQIFGGIKELEKTHIAGVMDSSGKLLLSSQNSVADEDVAEISKGLTNEQKEYFEKNIGKYVAVASQSNVNNYTCFLLSDRMETEKKVRSMWLKSLFLIIVLFIIQMILSVIYVYEYRESIKRIRKKLYSSADVSGRDDIYSLELSIDEAIKEYHSEVSGMKNQNIRMRDRAIYNALVHDLIYDCYEMTEVEEKIKSNHYAVAVFYISEFGEIMSDSKESRDAAVYCVQNVVSELLNEEFLTFVILQKDMIICLIGIQDELLEDFYHKIEEDAEKTLVLFEKHFEMELISGISKVLDFESFGIMYHEAIECVHEIIVGNVDERIIKYDKPKTINPAIRNMKENFSECLSGAIFAGKAQTSIELLNEELNTIENISPLKKTEKKFLLSKLLLVVIDICEKIDDELYVELMHYAQNIEHLITGNQFGELRKYLINKTIQACDIADEKRKNIGDVPQKLIKTIGENYLEPNFSSQRLADIHGLSVNYVLKLVKGYTGVSFVDYLNAMRIEKAKELLKTTDYPIGKIMELSGFASIATFNRVFRRLTGSSAGKWREANKD